MWNGTEQDRYIISQDIVCQAWCITSYSWENLTYSGEMYKALNVWYISRSTLVLIRLCSTLYFACCLCVYFEIQWILRNQRKPQLPPFTEPLWVTGRFPSQRASNLEGVSMSWRHHGQYIRSPVYPMNMRLVWLCFVCFSWQQYCHWWSKWLLLDNELWLIAYCSSAESVLCRRFKFVMRCSKKVAPHSFGLKLHFAVLYKWCNLYSQDHSYTHNAALPRQTCPISSRPIVQAVI